MKFLKTALIITASVFSFAANAQNAKETTVKFNKQERPAFVAEYNVPKKLMEETLQEKLNRAGSKGKKFKGFRKYEGVTLTELSPTKVDVYSKVKGSKSNAVVTLLISTGYDNFINSNLNSGVSSNAISMLNKLNEEAVAKKAAADLAAQQAALKKAEEKLKKSDKEAEKLAKKKADLDKKMAEENKTGSKASQDVEAEKIRLENLKNQKAE